MTDFLSIYQSKADLYDRLVSREDYQGNLPRLLASLADWRGKSVVEFGAGTGRVTRIVSPWSGRVRAYDSAEAMLVIARERAAAAGNSNCEFAVGDSRTMPCEDAVADISIAGWTFGHFTGWHPKSWKDEIGKALREMRRVTRPGGTMIVIETLGTGRETPEAPAEFLKQYYEWMETEWGFTRHAIRTDYQFESIAEAQELAGFFFGEAMAQRIERENLRILPECTGVWKTKAEG